MEQLLGRVSAMEQRTATIEQHVAALRAQLDGYAPVKVVHEMLQPLRETTIRLEVTISNLGSQMNTLFGLHEQLLKERSRLEREMAQEKLAMEQRLHAEKLAALKEANLWNILREKWLPIITLLGALFAAFVVVFKLLVKWGL